MTDFYLIGGGSSLRGFDWKRLGGKNVIAINRAFQVLPHAQWVYFSDFRFWNWHATELILHDGEKITATEKPVPDTLTRYKFTGITGLDMTPGKLRHGNSSGYAAINLAAHLGATRIFLLGYDMKKGTGGQTHWHSGYPVTAPDRALEKMNQYFFTLVTPLAALGIKVYNANPDSAIKSFDKITLDDALVGDWHTPIQYGDDLREVVL